MFKRLRTLIAPQAVPARGTSGESPLLRNDSSAEQRVALLDGHQITYTLKRSSKRRSIGLRIDDRGLTVSVPQKASEHWVSQVLQDRAGWVVEKLDSWLMRKPEIQQWADGATIPFLGELLVLRVGLVPCVLRDDELWVRGDEVRIERQVDKWYRQQAMLLLTARVAHYAVLLEVLPQQIKLSTAKTRWGSCSSDGTLRFNLQLIKLPQYLIDYVVVHELAHLHEMNHSAAFWRVVGSACPDYWQLRRELKGCSL